MKIYAASKYIKIGVFTMLFLQYCYAGYKIAANPMLFIASIWLLFSLSIILTLVVLGVDTY